MSFSNFVRPANITNLTMNEFLNVVVNQENTICTVQVKEHKTKTKFGAAYIHMTKSTYNLMNIYKQYFREGDIENFFINANRDPYTTPSLLRITKNLWKKAKISNTDFAFGKVRHSIVTYVHSNKPDFKEHLAQQMLHSSNTASKYYRDLLNTMESQVNFQKINDELKKKHQSRLLLKGNHGAH